MSMYGCSSMNLFKTRHMKRLCKGGGGGSISNAPSPATIGCDNDIVTPFADREILVVKRYINCIRARSRTTQNPEGDPKPVALDLLTVRVRMSVWKFVVSLLSLSFPKFKRFLEAGRVALS